MAATPDDLFARFAELGIDTDTTWHEAVFTVEDSRRLRGEIPGGHCKSLFLKDKKGALWLVVADEGRRAGASVSPRRSCHAISGAPNRWRSCYPGFT